MKTLALVVFKWIGENFTGSTLLWAVAVAVFSLGSSLLAWAFFLALLNDLTLLQVLETLHSSWF